MKLPLMKLRLRNTRRNIGPEHGGVRLRALACALIALGATSVGAQVEDDAKPDVATPASYAEFQYATLTGTNNVINVSMLPLVSATGAVVYSNMTLQFNVSSTGVVTLAAGSPTVVAAPTPQVSSFEAGNYVGPSSVFSGETAITLSGPGVTAGGSTEWSIAGSGATNSCTFPSSGTFYVGPITSSPLYSRLTAAGITSTAYSYGIIGSAQCVPNGYWDSGGLIGLSQTAGALTIVSFSVGTGRDYSTPKDQITYTLKH